MTLDEGHPKMMVVKIFFFCVVRLLKPVMESLVCKGGDWDKLLVATSFSPKFNKMVNHSIAEMGSKYPSP